MAGVGIDSVRDRHGRGGGWAAGARPKKRKKRKHRRREEQPGQEHGTEEHAQEVLARHQKGEDSTEASTVRVEDLLDPVPTRPKNTTAVRTWEEERPFEPARHAATLAVRGRRRASLRYTQVRLPSGDVAGLVASAE